LTYSVGNYVTWAGKVYKARDAVPINTEPPSSAYWSLIEEHDNSLQYPISYTVQRSGVVYISTSIVPVSNEYIAEDGGEILISDISLPFTTSSLTAQRLATIVLKKSRYGITVSYPCNLKAAHLDAMDCVLVNNERLGWVNKLFKIMSWSFSTTGGVDLTLVEDDAAIWLDPSEYGALTPPTKL